MMLPAPDSPLVFFSGGTALRGLSGYLASRTSSTVHLITPFDSGGSTAVLRAAFAMPAIGDMRNRLLALADPALTSPKVLELCDLRLPAEGDADALRSRLVAMGSDSHPVWADLPKEAARVLLAALRSFLANMPARFDARNASLGNLFMAGCYLSQDRNLSAVLGIFSRLLHVRGTVLPVVEENLHLAARLEDGSVLVGQHLFKNLSSPVERLFLTVHEPHDGARARTACRPPAAAAALARLRSACLVCFPMGSFYTSVVANLLPAGIGRTVAKARCPKVFIPNVGRDSELLGRSLLDQVAILLDTLSEDCPEAAACDLLTHVAVDTARGDYGVDAATLKARLAGRGIALADTALVEEGGARHDAQAVGDWLLGLCGASCAGDGSRG